MADTSFNSMTTSSPLDFKNRSILTGSPLSQQGNIQPKRSFKSTNALAQPTMPTIINKIILDWEKKLNQKLEILCMNSYEILGGDGDEQIRALNFNVYIKRHKRYRKLKSKQSLHLSNTLRSIKKDKTARCDSANIK